MVQRGNDSDLEQVIREFVQEIVNEFTGAAACPGYTLPLGMSMDPESLSSKPKLKGKWRRPKYDKKKKHRVNESTKANLHDLARQCLTGDDDAKLILVDALLESTGNERAIEDIKHSMNSNCLPDLRRPYLERGLQRAGLSDVETKPWLSKDDPEGNKRRVVNSLLSLIRSCGLKAGEAMFTSPAERPFGGMTVEVPILDFDDIEASLVGMFDYEETALQDGENDENAIVLGEKIELETAQLFNEGIPTYYASIQIAENNLVTDLERIRRELSDIERN